jgi:hypothetical protein
MSFFDVAANDPWYIKATADAILTLHVGGGSLGMASGAVSLIAPKGGRLHAVAGTTFFASMLTMATIGAGYPIAGVAVGAAPLLVEAPNIIAGLMTLYLISTSWTAIRRKDGRVGRVEAVGFFAALGVAAAGGAFIVIASRGQSGTIGSTPPQAFYVFMLVGSIAALSDLKVLLSRRLEGLARVARHLWRMCVALTIATGSFFLGQQRVMPHAMQGSPWLYAPVFAPLLLMVFWLVRVRLGKGRSGRAVGSAAMVTVGRQPSLTWRRFGSDAGARS